METIECFCKKPKLENRPKFEYLISQDYAYGNFRKFVEIQNYEELKNYVIEYKNCYDLPRDDLFRKLIFDFDLKSENEQQFKNDQIDMKNDIKILIEYLEKLSQEKIKYVIEDSSRMINENKFKSSFHLFIMNYYFNDTKETKKFIDFLCEILPFKKLNFINVIDRNIYNTEEELRFLYCKKNSDKNNESSFLRLYEKNFDCEDEFEYCFLNGVDEIHFFNDIEHQIQEIKKKEYVFLSNVIENNGIKFDTIKDNCKYDDYDMIKFIKKEDRILIDFCDIEQHELCKEEMEMLENLHEYIFLPSIKKREEFLTFQYLCCCLMAQLKNFEEEQLLNELYKDLYEKVINYRQEDFNNMEKFNLFEMTDILFAEKKIQLIKKENILKLFENKIDDKFMNRKLENSISAKKKEQTDSEKIICFLTKNDNVITKISKNEQYTNWHELIDSKIEELIVKAEAGKGKTFSFMEFLDFLPNDENVFIPTVRKALGDEYEKQIEDINKKRKENNLPEFKILRKDIEENYEEDYFYNDENNKKVLKKLGEETVFIVEFQSLHKLENSFVLKKKFTTILDECLTLHQMIRNNDNFHCDTFYKNNLVLEELLRKPFNEKDTKLILMDANINEEFLKDLWHINFMTNKTELILHEGQKKYENVSVTHDLNLIKEKIDEFTEEREKFSICSCTKKSIEVINDYVKQTNKNIKTICINSLSDFSEKKKFCRDSTKYIEDNDIDLLLFNSSIICGIDIQTNFDTMICIIDMIFEPEEIYQLIYRCRKVKNLIIYFKHNYFGSDRNLNEYEFLEYIDWKNIEMMDSDVQEIRKESKLEDIFGEVFNLTQQRIQKLIYDELLSHKNDDQKNNKDELQADCFQIEIKDFIFSQEFMSEENLQSIAFFRNKDNQQEDIHFDRPEECLSFFEKETERNIEKIKEKIYDYQFVYFEILQTDRYFNFIDVQQNKKLYESLIRLNNNKNITEKTYKKNLRLLFINEKKCNINGENKNKFTFNHGFSDDENELYEKLTEEYKFW